MAYVHTQVPRVDGLSYADQDVLTGLINQLNAKSKRNRMRRQYSDGKQGLKDLGISLPPSLTDIEAVVQWPAKAVNSVARRTRLLGFDSSGTSAADLGVVEMWDRNRMYARTSNAHTSALRYAAAFGFVTNGDVEAGDSDVVLTTRSALDATGFIDTHTGSLATALEITARDDRGLPVSMVMHFPGRYVIIEWDGRRWRGFERTHSFGMLAEPIPYLPDDDRPLGRSRISRSVMYYTDSAIRTMLRTEVGAEFYNAPQRYALGADDDAFEDEDGTPIPGWQIMLGRLLTMSRDEEGKTPEVGQFSQQSMEPNVAQLRMIALMFAGETNLSPGSLGIIQDNPESAEAMRTRLDELGADITHWQSATLGPAWKRLVTTGLRMVDDSPAARAEYAGLTPNWAPWAEMSEVSQAQASLARVQAIPRLAETTVELRRMGYTQAEIAQIQSELARSSSRSTIQALLDQSSAADAQAAADALSQ